ncbi:tonoplast monosaccharide transporter2 [Striga asiatica]|uniref:Tonoplast monosaccharide transporter2 n=1 Tax=Striga asiatica TaxID=4170 RepID=A0A5A7PSA3_STRAF|nr:tonoplast monosaccharide transporter2 [Striga asiatica]
MAHQNDPLVVREGREKVHKRPGVVRKGGNLVELARVDPTASKVQGSDPVPIVLLQQVHELVPAPGAMAKTVHQHKVYHVKAWTFVNFIGEFKFDQKLGQEEHTGRESHFTFKYTWHGPIRPEFSLCSYAQDNRNPEDRAEIEI